MTAPDTELLGVAEVAAYLGLQPATVYRWCRAGQRPCLKLGKVWRVRRPALEEFLRQRERGHTLAAQLRAFLAVPDQVVAVAEDRDTMHRLDAAFFQVAAARGGRLVKFHHAAPDPAPALRTALTRHGLAVARLEGEGRLRFVAEPAPAHDRAGALRRLLAAEPARGEPLWAAFDWAVGGDLEAALRQQGALATLAAEWPLVVLTQVLEGVADAWPPAGRRRVRDLHRGLIELSAAGLSLSRRTPPPP